MITLSQEKRYYRYVIELLRPKENDRIIDIGYGIERPVRLNNVCLNIERAIPLPYGDNFFDCAISVFFFHHINFELKKRYLQEIWRTLKRNGRAVVIDIDIPTTFFGKSCAYYKYWISHQEGVIENIYGKLREAINLCDFRSWYQVSHHLGHISIFKLIK